MMRKNLFLLLLFGLFAFSPVAMIAQEDNDTDVEFDFDPSKFRKGKKSKKRTQTEGLWGFGPTFVNTNTELENVTYPEFKPWSSWSNDLGLMFRTRLGGENSSISLDYGLLWRYLNVEFDEYGMDWDGEEVSFTQDNDLENSELNIHTLSVPLMLEYSNKFSIAAGGFVAWRIGSNIEADQSTDFGDLEATLRDDFGLNDLLYGVTGQIGYKKIRLYANYYLNNLFADDEPYDFTVLNVGIVFF